MQRENNGSITVFLAITFIFIMAMLGTLIDGARLVEAHTQAYYAADLAASSALAEFDYDLKDRYGLFAYNGDPQSVIDYVVQQNLNALQNSDLSESEELEEWLTEVVSDALGVEDLTRSSSFDLLQFQNIQVSQYGNKISLHDPDEFERQVFEYVKFRAPIELFTKNLSIDFDVLDEELQKADNEAALDEIIQKLEETLAKHLEAQGQYNEDMQKFRQNMADIDQDYFAPIKTTLNTSPSLDGLSTLKGQMGRLGSALSVQDDCYALIEQIHALVEKRHEIIEEAGSIQNRFSGSGDSAMFDGKKISGEMLVNYIEDLKAIEQAAELKWDSSYTNAEIQKYEAINSAIYEIKLRIPVFQEDIQRLENEANAQQGSDDDDDDNSLDEKVDDLWDEVEGHFTGVLYHGPTIGVFSNADALKDLMAHAYEKAPFTLNDLQEAEKKSSEKDQKREFKQIPDGYTLPSSIPAEGVENQLSLDINSNFEGLTTIEAATDQRNNNKNSTKAIKDMFGGLGEFGLDTLDNAVLGLYAIGNFENALCFEPERPDNYGHDEIDVSDYRTNMRNDPIENFFVDCEVEYLVKGKPDEKDNYQGIRNELTGLCFTLNYAFVRRPKEIKDAVDAVAHAVELAITSATLGVGAGAGKIAYYATREACYAILAGMQTSHDLQRLYLGNKVPLLKKSKDDFCALSLFGGRCHDNAGMSQLAIGYTDYLFIRMIMAGQDNLRSRLQDLVELNMNNGNTARPFKLKEMYTSASVKVEATMPFFFINVMFLAENFDQAGMKVEKYASQKY